MTDETIAAASRQCFIFLSTIHANMLVLANVICRRD
jgi:hypothetical protein